MAYSHHHQDENVNILNVSAPTPKNTGVLCAKNNAIFSFPQILKEKILASTRSGPLAVYSEYFQDNRKVDRQELLQNSIYKLTRDASIRQQDSNDSDELTLDEIMQFRAASSSSDSDEQVAERPPPSTSLKNYQLTLPSKPLRKRYTTNLPLPTIFEVISADDSTVFTLTQPSPLCNDRAELDQIGSFEFDEVCISKFTQEELVEIIAVDMSMLGCNKLGVLLMHS